MATNALFDLEEDRRRFPARPLPSGRITALQAGALAGGLAAAAGALLFLVPAAVRITALILFGTILLYNTAGKRIPLVGPFLMGTCRGLNLLLGYFTVSGSETELHAILIPVVVLSAYTAFVTWINTREGKRCTPLFASTTGVLLLLFPAVLLGLSEPFSDPFTLIYPAAFVFLITAAVPWKGTGNRPLSEEPVHRLLPGILIIDGFFMARNGGLFPGLFCLALGLLPLCTRRFTRRSKRSGRNAES
jgi:4-hydroxybenzoate polyprenyltransferase